MKVLAIGEIIFDIFDGEAEIGGAPLNFCAHCARLGAESAIISRVGEDELGKEALFRLGKFGVSTAFVGRVGVPTGRCLVSVRDGSPTYDVIRPAAYDKIAIDEKTAEKIGEYGAGVLAFGTLIQRDRISRKAVADLLSRFDFPEIFCDVNLRSGCYDEDSCLRCLENATILKVSGEEEPELAGFGFYKSSEKPEETAKNVCKAFPNIKVVVYTMGEDGSLVYEKPTGKIARVRAEKTRVASTVGAGDAYSAAFLREYFKSRSPEAAAAAGSKLAAFVVSRREAVPEFSV